MRLAVATEKVFINSYVDAFFQDVPGNNPIVHTSIFLLAVLNLFYHVTLPACRATAIILKRLILQIARGRAYEDIESVVRSIPADVSTIIKAFNVSPDCINYACCPQCFALYPPEFTSNNALPNCTTQGQSLCQGLPFYEAGDVVGPTPRSSRVSPSPEYPRHCTYREFPGAGDCGATLVRASKSSSASAHTTVRPIKTYCYQSLHSWIARMLSRPDFESMIDKSLVVNQSATRTHIVDDILQSSEVRTFQDSDQKPFLRQEGSEARLLFSLFIDWFNPRGNRRAGSSISSGVIFMACLNLPPELRYRKENLYLAGVLPGPKGPSVLQVNHFLRPLVGELSDLWKEGLEVSKTASHPSGRRVRGALIPLVSDLGAVRKTAGQASHSATYFCSFCQLKKPHINNLDVQAWPRRDCTTFRRHAEAWRDAPDDKARTRLFKSQGIRHSVLLDLQYWKPTRFVVLDTMHNMYLGLFQRHCRNVFGMNIDVDGDKEAALANESVRSFTSQDIEKAIHQLRHALSPESLRDKLNLPLIRILYELGGLGAPGKRTKLEMAKELVAQVGRFVISPDRTSSYLDHQRDYAVQKASSIEAVPRTSVAPSRTRKATILDKHVLEEVRADIAITMLPTYLGRAPVNVGSAGAGTLSADQWRTFCAIHLVVTLTRIWGNLPRQDQRYEMLDNYLNLVVSVRYGCIRRITPNRIVIYQRHIMRYVEGLRKLFPDQDLVPNQHLALHLGEVMERFGPTTAYWAFPFERGIRLLRQAKINYRNSTFKAHHQ